jgi:hypothetical protein
VVIQLRRGVGGIICVGLLLSMPTALAYRDVGHDPDDRPAVGTDPDIRSTTRRVFTDAVGHHWFRVTFSAYEQLTPPWNVSARLDTEQGPKQDYVMFINTSDSDT